MSKGTVPTLRYTIGSTVTPGDRIGTIRQVKPGKGTYVKGGQIYASLVGKLALQKQNEEYLAVVETRKEIASAQVLSVGQVVLGRVRRITTQMAVLSIVAVQGAGTLSNPHEGAIRREDIRTGASEKVQIQESFLPGDLVLCRVLSLGDNRRYFLSTAEPELGVLHAKSKTSGQPMIPCSWKEMECPETGLKEPRKCARPRDVSANLQPLAEECGKE